MSTFTNQMKSMKSSLIKVWKKSILTSLVAMVFSQPITSQSVSFTKIVIDSTYVSSGICSADIDGDGLEDVVAGDVWYQSPNWKKWEIRPAGVYRGTLVDEIRWGPNARYYGRSIGNYTRDIDGDGLLDVITFNSQGAPCYWYRNPGQPYDKTWEEFLAIEIFHNESPQIVDLFGDGDEVVLAGHRIAEGKYSLSWFVPGQNPQELWEANIIGHPDSFDYSVTYRSTDYFAPGGRGHGLGIGDINMDGVQDVITPQGWYEGPREGRGKLNWKFHRIPFDTLADPEGIHLTFAQMYASDFDGDGNNDIIGGSAHRYGLWWFEQVNSNTQRSFIAHEISMDYSQLHAMLKLDLDGDGVDEYVTGKRYLAHLGRDPGWNDGAALLYLDNVGEKDSVRFEVHLIDNNSGSGTQIWSSDLNSDGKPDLITSNKKGTNLFIQE